TGAPVALIDATGLDMAAALAHGRRAGVELRKSTFHKRAGVLKALGQATPDRLRAAPSADPLAAAVQALMDGDETRSRGFAGRRPALAMIRQPVRVTAAPQP
ncbi:MAG TPA: hypothetical protein PKD10_01035, partial [Paracoccaceae bacterium]|nr:hypothetical protein [Paracoccaceae bacterium]